MNPKMLESLQIAGQLLAEHLGHPKGEPIEMRICQPKNACLHCLEIYVAESDYTPCPNCGSAKCRHAWIVENKCAWCGEKVAPSPVERINHFSTFDDDIEIDEINCPNCGANTRSRDCLSLFCDDGYIDEYEDDAINFALGESYLKCDECHGTGIERWCPDCGWQWRGKRLSG